MFSIFKPITFSNRYWDNLLGEYFFKSRLSSSFIHYKIVDRNRFSENDSLCVAKF
ncbi:Uncharacterised protein [Acinetobacter baumannii]|nr:Uncharacterised protein [Acinetobacter baumannii]SSS27100.1 Uncharacterised protein [Acinetobacter baumannii]